MRKDKRPEWLIKLDAVAMTIAQSKQVKRRNKGLLDELARVEAELLNMKVPKGWGGPMFSTDIGCPHCGGLCTDCAWHVYSPGGTRGKCIDAEFDGVRLDVVDGLLPLSLEYLAGMEMLVMHKTKTCTRQDMVECIALIRKFLNAHITWAEDNIRRRREK